MATAEEIQDELETAAIGIAEHGRLTERLQRADQAVEETTAEVERARGRLATEAADVERLESLSPTRIWAAIRGVREVELDKERAEQQAAEYLVATAEAARDRALADQERVRRELHSLGDVEGRMRAALDAKAAWIKESGADGVEELEDIAAKTGAARSELTEVGEAVAAAAAAGNALHEAGEWLGKARDWSTYDTFFGGGLVGDALKYDRMDKAADLMRRADVALHKLGDELADIGRTGVTTLGIDGMVKAFDVWFDNIFSDWAVRNRITEAQEKVAQASDQIAQLHAELSQRASALRGQLKTLAARREKILTGK